MCQNSSHLLHYSVRLLRENLSQSYRLQVTQIACHPTQVNPSQTGRNLIYLPWRDGRLSWPWCWSYTEIFTYSQTVTHPRLGVKLVTTGS